MTFEEAINKAVQTYWENEDDDDMPTIHQGKTRKYTKSYMNSVSDEYLTKKDKDKKLPKEESTDSKG